MALIAMTAASVLFGCASIGNPSGGPRDEDPPRMVGSFPLPGATDVHGRRVEILFDELVEVKDAFTNVTVSPPAQTSPRVSAQGRKVLVQWEDALQSNTTYTIDFGQSIQDVNESNKLGAFSFTFSTGAELDSLRLGGVVLDAYTLEPQQNMLVGVHHAESPDSALRTLRFERATRTDERGRFVLRGLKAVPYLLYALGDLNNDYRRDNPAELIAWYPEPVTPYSERTVTSDTVYNLLTGAVDTVRSREMTRFFPNNLLLSLYDEGYKQQYLANSSRPDSARMQLLFNAPSKTLPMVTVVDIPGDHGRLIAEHSPTMDTLNYWIADPWLASRDTVAIAVTYCRTAKGESGLEETTDTIYLKKPKIPSPPKGKRTKQQLIQDSISAEKNRWVQWQLLTGNGGTDVYRPIVLESPEPLTTFDMSKLSLYQKADTTWTRQESVTVLADTAGNPRRWYIHYPWQYGAQYKLEADSLAGIGISARPTGALTREFRIKDQSDYASLVLRLTPDTVQGFVEILTPSEQVVARVRVKDGVAKFPFLSASDYYARFITAPDSVMQFVPGNYELKRQPSEVSYYPGLLSLKRHDRSETWNIYGTPVDMQKPDAIKKNKPQVKSVRSKKNSSPTTENEDEDYFANPAGSHGTRKSTVPGAKNVSTRL